MGHDVAEDQSSSLDRIAIVDLADELQVRKQWLFKIIKRLGIEGRTRREPDRRNQLVATVTRAEAEVIRQEVETFRAGQRVSVENDGEELDTEVGFFYIVQLEPEHDPGRIKVGFTTELDGRIRKHRCSAPFAVYTKSWSCRRSWERTAMDCVTVGLEQLHTEVFRAASILELIERGNQFFAAMPPVPQKEMGTGEP